MKPINLTESDVKRFMSKFVLNEENGCWEWIAGINRGGYGTFNVGAHDTLLAHRVSWTVYNNEDPSDLYVLHSCDNPKCVNIDHLFLGTLDDNNKDMKAKGRAGGYGLPGEKNGNSVLSWEEARTIRRLYNKGDTLQRLATTFGVSTQTIWNIGTNRAWKEI